MKLISFLDSVVVLSVPNAVLESAASIDFRISVETRNEQERWTERNWAVVFTTSAGEVTLAGWGFTRVYDDGKPVVDGWTISLTRLLQKQPWFATGKKIERDTAFVPQGYRGPVVRLGKDD